MKYPVAPAPGSVLSVSTEIEDSSSERLSQTDPNPSFELANRVSQQLNSYFNVVFLETSYELDGETSD